MKLFFALIILLAPSFSFATNYRVSNIECQLGSEVSQSVPSKSVVKISLPNDVVITFQSLQTTLGLTYHGFIVQKDQLQLTSTTLVTSDFNNYIDGVPTDLKVIPLEVKGKIAEDLFSCRTTVEVL